MGVWEKTLTKQGHAIAPPHIKNDSKITKIQNPTCVEVTIR